MPSSGKVVLNIKISKLKSKASMELLFLENVVIPPPKSKKPTAELA
jgi:hypothetical protein